MTQVKVKLTIVVLDIGQESDESPTPSGRIVEKTGIREAVTLTLSLVTISLKLKAHGGKSFGACLAQIAGIG
ncbi:MAG: hypothetical protein F6K50_23010 [Moorea sp. SIO3I7]|uniref:hypothetical protein n=1 Tax=unclassified Moorena TaxID=2683338 RepID=UPI0013C112CD|nr:MULTISPECIES: hypothetical protein [unclassified Moorena]NEN98280.1 hypothetical protein [Moorena sp. SIO3I7]NEO05431.1 hypothetical protein [Moorena sp. SIO3I8]NEO22914.1 hypothetical protein [Moorena sp. SIO4A5]NEP24978.1 hypothetical protein [Moorena sp. SIO3I6]NEQ61932.1 hypothetical protein [Moorena sp. SIO4A1]